MMMRSMMMITMLMMTSILIMRMTTLSKSQWQGPSNESGLSVYWAIGNQTDQKPDDDDDGGGDGGGDEDDDDDLQADGGVLMVQIRDRNENISVGISALFTLFIRIGIFVQILKKIFNIVP